MITMDEPDKNLVVYETTDRIFRELQLRKGIHYIDMDQTNELAKLDYLLNIINDTDSKYNFSEATALELIRGFMHKQYTLKQPTTIALICLYIPVFFLSLIGNGLVIFVVIRNQHMRRVKNLFLLNLALADLLVTLICMPMVVGQTVFRLWVYGAIMCKLSVYTQGVAVTASIFTLTALSIDRYLAIKAPLSLRRISGKCQATRFLFAIWLLAAIFVGPMLFVRSVYGVTFSHFHISMAYCIEKWPKSIDRETYGIFMLVINYVIPILTITTCYIMIGRTLCSDEFHRKTSDSSSTVMLGRKRVARMLIALIAVFFVCWLPYNITSLSLDFEPSYRGTQILPFTMLFAHAHSAINPLLYWFLNKGFRHCMKKALRCQPVKKNQKDTPSPHSGGGDIGDILRFELRPGGHRVARTTSSSHRNSPAGPKVVRLKIHGRPQSSLNSSSSRSPRSSTSSERHPNADRRTTDRRTDRRLVRLDFTPPTSSSRMVTGTSGHTGSSHHGIVSLEVHYEAPDVVYTTDNRSDEDISRSPSISSFTKPIEDDSSV